MASRSIAGARTLVTGASSGVGRALSREFAKSGSDVVITARRRELLESLGDELHGYGTQVRQVCGDITDPAVRDECLDAANQLGGLDFLVNNAGVGALGPFAAADPDRLRRVMEINFFAPLELIRAAIPQLRASDRAMIVNVGSVLGHRAVPNKSEYCASKFALHGFSDALRTELHNDGIAVLLVSPSTIATEFFDHVLDRDPNADNVKSRGTPPHIVARKTLRAIRRGRHEIILTCGGRLLVWGDRLAPSLMDHLIRWSGGR